MRSFILFISFFTIFLGKSLSQDLSKQDTSDEKYYTKIPLKYQETDSLVKNVIPDKNYTYWEFVNGNLDGGYKRSKVIFSKGKKPNDIQFKDPGGMLFWDCPPGICYKYIAYVFKGEIGYINTNAGFIKFMGKIDNLEEAILLAETSEDLTVSSIKKGGAYLKTKSGFELIMTKGIDCPVTDEAIQLTIDKTGIKKKRSRGVYYKSTDCYKI